jgi:hypothetical protein
MGWYIGEDEHNDRRCQLPSHKNNCSSIWPEHAGPTESVTQWSIKYLNLGTFAGVSKSNLLRTLSPLDSDTKPLRK